MANPSQKAIDQSNAAYDKKQTQIIGNDGNADNEDAAKKKIISELRGKNQNETTFNFTLLGDLNWAPGKVVALDGTFGVFAGNYAIDKVVHRIGRQGFTSEVEAHKGLRGHDPGTAPSTSGTRPYSPGSVFSDNGSPNPTPIAAQLGPPTAETVAQASAR